MSPAKDPDQAPDVTLSARTDQYADSLRAYAKKLNGISGRLKRSGSDANSRSTLLSGLFELLSQGAALGPSAQILVDEWERALTVNFLQLESNLREICRQRGWRLDGQWPDFIVEYGIPLHVDDKRRRIQIGNSNPVSLGELEQTLASASVDLIPSRFSAPSFLSQLAIAYDKLAPEHGSQVAILDVYKELVIQTQSSRFWRDATVVSFAPLTMQQFKARFSRTLQEAAVTIADGRELRLFPALNPKDAVFLYQPSEKRFGYVGRIEFRTI